MLLTFTTSTTIWMMATACIMVDDSLYDAALDAFDEYDIEYEEV